MPANQNTENKQHINGVFSKFERKPNGSYISKDKEANETLICLTSEKWKYEIHTDNAIEEFLFKIDTEENIKPLMRKIVDKKTGAGIKIIYNENGMAQPIRINNSGIVENKKYEGSTECFPQIPENFILCGTNEYLNLKFEYWENPSTEEPLKKIHKSLSLTDGTPKTLNVSLYETFQVGEKEVEQITDVDRYNQEGEEQWIKSIFIKNVTGKMVSFKMTVEITEKDKKYIITAGCTYTLDEDHKISNDFPVERDAIKLTILHYDGDILLEENLEKSSENTTRQSYAVSIRDATNSYCQIIKNTDNNQAVVLPDLVSVLLENIHNMLQNNPIETYTISDDYGF